jgi:hypothetical protein
MFVGGLAAKPITLGQRTDFGLAPCPRMIGLATSGKLSFNVKGPKPETNPLHAFHLIYEVHRRVVSSPCHSVAYVSLGRRMAEIEARMAEDWKLRAGCGPWGRAAPSTSQGLRHRRKRRVSTCILVADPRVGSRVELCVLPSGPVRIQVPHPPSRAFNKDPAFLTDLAAHVVLTRTPTKAVGRLGLQDHPSLQLASHYRDRIFAKVIYRCDPDTLYRLPLMPLDGGGDIGPGGGGVAGDGGGDVAGDSGARDGGAPGDVPGDGASLESGVGKELGDIVRAYALQGFAVLAGTVGET